MYASYVTRCLSFPFRLLFFDADYHDAEAETESSEAAKSEEMSSLQNLLTELDQQPQSQDTQQSGPLLEFGADASPVQPTAQATTLTAEKCTQNILIIF
jgi:hypothetical protein